MTIKSWSWHQKYVMTSKIRTYVKKLALTSKCSWCKKTTMMTKCSSLLQKVRHNIKKTSLCQEVCHDVKSFVKTQPLVSLLGLYRSIITVIIQMHDHAYRNPLPPPSRMLANKHVLYLYYIVFNVLTQGLRPHPGTHSTLCTIEPLYLVLYLKCLNRGRVRNIGDEIPWRWSLPECFASSVGSFTSTLNIRVAC